MDERRGGLSSSCGAFQGLKIQEWHCETWGTGSDWTEIRMPRCPRSVDATWGRVKRRFSFNPVYRPRQRRLLVSLFRCFALQLQKAISFNGSANLGEFYVKSKGFPCSTWKLSDFGRMDKKRGGLSSSCGAFSGLKIPEWHARNVGYGARTGTEIRMPRCPRFGRCYVGKSEAPFQFDLRLSPRQRRLLVPFFARFALPTSKGHIFSTARPIWVNFMSNQRVFRALHGNRSDFGRMDEKKRGLSSSCGAFQGLRIRNGTARNVGYGLRTEPRFVCHVVLVLVDATWGRANLRFKFNLRLSPRQRRLLVPFFAVSSSELQKAISFQRSANLGEFYVKSKGFPCSTWKSKRFWKNGRKKRGPFFLMWGLFEG